MKEIKLANGMIALVDDADYALLDGYPWQYDSTGGYARSYVGTRNTRRYFQMHRLILNVSEDVLVDHVNGNGLDNRRDNLRMASQSQNQQNTFVSPTSKTGYKGVHWDKERSKYRVEIMKDKRHYRLGRFATAEDAARAYDAAARELFGEYARLNFPLPGERPARRQE